MGPAEEEISRRTRAGSVRSRRGNSPWAVLLCLLPMLGSGAELTLWLALRASFAPGNLEVRCFLALDPGERKSVMEKDRRGRAASSGACAVGRPRCALLSSCAWDASFRVEMTAVMLIGVPGRLTKYTLSPSSLEVSSTSSAPFVDTDLANTSVGWCFSSGNILLSRLPFAMEPRLLSVFSLDSFAVKKCAY